MEISVESLHIYPLKSAKAVSLETMEIVSSGPQWDRQWMLVDEDFDFISQRKATKLCLIEQRLTNDHLILNAPGMNELQIPLERSETPEAQITIFNQETKADLMSNTVNEWCSDFLERKCMMVRSPEEASRYTSGRHGPKKEILFPDGYPFLLTTKESIDELNDKMDQPVSMAQFRPNIVVSGAPANAEEDWKSFSIGNINFDSVKACSRCVVISVNQETAQKNNEVVVKLNSYRKKDGQIIFGRNLIHHSNGRISVGDKLKLTL